MPYSVYVNTSGAERLLINTYFCYSGLTPGVKIGQHRVGPPWKPFLVLLILFIWFTLYSSCLLSRCSIVISIVIFHQYFSIKFSSVFLYWASFVNRFSALLEGSQAIGFSHPSIALYTGRYSNSPARATICAFNIIIQRNATQRIIGYRCANDLAGSKIRKMKCQNRLQIYHLMPSLSDMLITLIMIWVSFLL